MDESDRILAVEDYHNRAHIKLPDIQVHAIFHTIIKSQIAEGLKEVVEAMERLQSQGLDHHEAIYAVASVLSEFLYDILHNPAPYDILGAPNNAYLEEVSKLTKKSWHRKYKKERRRNRR